LIDKYIWKILDQYQALGLYITHGHAVYRGVQYVHWVMRKCIMVKVGGKYT